MSDFTDLVARAGTLVKGIDWDKLESQSRGIPLDPNVPPHLGYWVDYLAPAFNAAADVVNTLYYDPIIVNTAATQDAMDYMYKLLQDLAPGVQSFVRFQNLSLLFSPIPLPIEDFRQMVSFIWGVIMYGTRLHTTFAITAVGRQKWREHADRIVRMCEALVMLDKAGALARLKWNSQEMVDLRNQQRVPSLKPFTDYVNTAPPTPVSGAPDGLGSAQLVIAAIVTTGLAVVLIYGLYSWSSATTEINKQTLEATAQICADPSYANDPATKDKCVKVLGDALAKTTMIKPPGSDWITYAVAAAAIVGAVIAAPYVIKLVKATRPAAA